MTKKKQLLIIAIIVTSVVCALCLSCVLAGYYFKDWCVIIFGAMTSTLVVAVYGAIIINEIKESRKTRK